MYSRVRIRSAIARVSKCGVSSRDSQSQAAIIVVVVVATREQVSILWYRHYMAHAAMRPKFRRYKASTEIYIYKKKALLFYVGETSAWTCWNRVNCKRSSELIVFNKLVTANSRISSPTELKINFLYYNRTEIVNRHPALYRYKV